MKPSYSERCLIKVKILLDEIIDEIRMKHICKIIPSLWEIAELLIRAVIFCLKKTTYERPAKLISVFNKLYSQLYKPAHPVTSALNMLYNLRRKIVHKPTLPTSQDLTEAKTSFCVLVKAILHLLENLGFEVNEILEKTQKVCREA